MLWVRVQCFKIWGLQGLARVRAQCFWIFCLGFAKSFALKSLSVVCLQSASRSLCRRSTRQRRFLWCASGPGRQRLCRGPSRFRRCRGRCLRSWSGRKPAPSNGSWMGLQPRSWSTTSGRTRRLSLAANKIPIWRSPC